MFDQRTKVLLDFAGTAALAVMTACATPPEQPRVEQPPTESVQPPAPATEQAKPQQTLKLPLPSQAEVRSAIARIYKDAVIVDASRFVVGDFNGDGSQDVAVAVKVAPGKVAEINSEVANWILEDPHKIVLPEATKATQPLARLPKPTRAEQSDTLLAVLHGYGPSGWRDPNSRQTYLLKDAAGDNLMSQALGDFRKTNGRTSTLPKPRGDVINETIGSESGFLYYSGAKYVWYRKSGMGKSVASR